MSFARSSALLVLLLGSWSMTPAAQVPDTSITIDGRDSSARFIVHLRLRLQAAGALTGVTGELRGSAEQGWQVLVKVDGRTLRVEGPRWMERVTRSDSFLAVNRYPAIRFNSDPFSDEVLRAGGPVSGQLTLRGLTQPVSFELLPSTCDLPGRDCDIQVNGTISRHAFGMTSHRATVRDDVDFQMRVRLQAPSPAP